MLIATAGHVDHGKTTLVRALTGVDGDRLAEEKRRGITIALGYAEWALPAGPTLSVIDVPGHEKLVRTMLVGAGGIDLVLLAVAADAGVMPQTREHLNACAVLGVRHGVVAMTFADRVDDRVAAIARVRAGLSGSPLADAPIVPVCALTGEGLPALATAVADLIPKLPATDRERLPVCLPVDRVFSIEGFGTVVTGSLLRGVLAVGDTVDLMPGPTGVRVRGLQVHGQPVERAVAGRRTAINLAIDRDAVGKEAILCAPGQVHAGRVLDAEITWLAHLPDPLTRARALTLHIGAGRAVADVHADDPIAPGATGTARIRLDRALPLPPGLRFVLRGESDARSGAVVGGGRILDPRPPRRRNAAGRAALATATPEGAIALLLAYADRHGLDPQRLSARLPIPARAPGPPLLAEAAIADEAERLIQRARHHHEAFALDPGLPMASLPRDALGRAGLQRALDRGALLREAAYVRTPDHLVHLDADRERLAGKLMRAIGKGGLAGPTEDELQARYPVGPEAVHAVLMHLERTGRVVRSSGFCFPGREAHALRAQAARAALLGVELSVAWLKEIAGVTRRHAIPLFNWLDATGATRRAGDVRVAGARARQYADAPLSDPARGASLKETHAP